RTLNYMDEKALSDLYLNYGLKVEIFALIFTYCSEVDKNNVNYAKLVAINWIENNITTTEKAEAYLKAISYHKIILSYIGSEKKLTIVEEAMINKWIIEYEMPMDVIERACEISIKNDTGGSLRYIDAILKNWFSKEIKTLEAVDKDKEDFDKEHAKKNNTKKNNTYSKPKSSFFNYTSSEISDELLEKIKNQNFN
ncbi:MAG: DnaD domain protein, partial [bacterium]